MGNVFETPPRSGPRACASSSLTARPAAMFPCPTPPTTRRIPAISTTSLMLWVWVSATTLPSGRSGATSATTSIHRSIRSFTTTPPTTAQSARRPGRALQLFLQHRAELLMMSEAIAMVSKQRYLVPAFLFSWAIIGLGPAAVMSAAAWGGKAPPRRRLPP